MLFQPTNITPSLLGELGNGTVDITDTSGLTVSWQVNGNSPMTKFQIDIYENNAASTLLYSTGVKTDGCPFSPTDASGNQQFFSYTIPSGAISDDFFSYTYECPRMTSVSVSQTTFRTKAGSQRGEFLFATTTPGTWYVYIGGQLTRTDIAEWGITYTGSSTYNDKITVLCGAQNGTDLKLKITQYWSNTEYVVQRSMSQFVTKSAPVLNIGSFSVTSPAKTITGHYSQAQGDPLNWARWILVHGTDYDNPLVDTGNMYGATTLSLTYEGFINGETYAVKLMVETASGVAAETAWRTFTVTYSATSFGGDITAEPKKDKSGVLVKWTKPDYISGSYTGTVPTITTANCSIPSSSTVYWDEVSGDDMDFPEASLWWSGTSVGAQNNIVKIYDTDGDEIVTARAVEDGSVFIGRVVDIFSPERPIKFALSGNNELLLFPKMTDQPYSKIYSTRNLATFSEIRLPTFLWFEEAVGAAYGDNKYAVITEDGIIGVKAVASTTWQAKSCPAVGKIIGIYYHGTLDRFVVVSQKTSTTTGIYYTTDFATWGNTEIQAKITAVISAGYGMALAGRGEIYYSMLTLDPNAWTQTTLPSGYRSVIWTAGCAAGNRHVFVGSHGGTGYLIESSDGMAWNTGHQLPISAPDSVGGGTVSGLHGTQITVFTAQSSTENKAIYTCGATPFSDWTEYQIGTPMASAFYSNTGAVFGSNANKYDCSIIKPKITVSATINGSDVLSAQNIMSTSDMMIGLQEIDGKSNITVESFIAGTRATGAESTAGSAVYNISSVGKIELIGAQNCRYVAVCNKKRLAETKIRSSGGVSYPVCSPDYNMVANFINSNLEAGTISSLSTSAKVTIFRQEKGKSEYTKIGSFNAIGADAPTSLIDCATPNQATVRYAMCIGLSSGAIGLINSNYVKPLSWSWDLIACDIGADGFYHAQEVYRFIYNLSTGSIGNNGGNNLLSNFTRYPTVQYAPHNYASGTLSGLIGSVSKGAYTDSVSLKNAIYRLSDGYDALFLKSIKGDVWKIAVVGQIAMTTSDATKEQAQTVSIPWAEVGSMDGVQVVIDEASDLWEG